MLRVGPPHTLQEAKPNVIAAPIGHASDNVTDVENSKWQQIWDRPMREELELPEGYLSVAVLIIKWAPEIDELKTGSEVVRPLQISWICAYSSIGP